MATSIASELVRGLTEPGKSPMLHPVGHFRYEEHVLSISRTERFLPGFNIQDEVWGYRAQKGVDLALEIRAGQV